MDITSIGGATPATPLLHNPQQGRAPATPVSRETMADNASSSKGTDGARQTPPGNMPVVGKEEAGGTNWPRQPGAEAQNVMGNQARRGQVASQAASQAGAEPESVLNRPISTEQKAEMAKQELAELQKSVEKISQFVLLYNSSLNFSVDKDSGRLVVKVVDNETQEVIKQIPSEDAIKLARSLEQLQGLLVRQEA